MKVDRGRAIVSFRDKLLSFNGEHTMESEEDEIPFDEDDEDWEEHLEGDKGANEDLACLVVWLTQKQRKELFQLWKKSFIVKLLGKRIGICFLKMKVQKMEALQGSFEFINMENDYYLVRFSETKDYNYVM